MHPLRSTIIRLVDCECLTDSGWVRCLGTITAMCVAIDANGDWQGLTIDDRPYVAEFARRMLAEIG